MKRVAFAVFLGLFFLSLALPALTVADTEGQSANGTFQVLMENGQSLEIKFTARSAKDGSTTGEITFRDGVSASDPKSAGKSTASDATPRFYAKAACDCLLVKGIEAVISGTITEASSENFIGRRVLLAVQDGDSITPPLRDKLTFGFYKTTTREWVATDGERPDEQGPAPTWVATDAERSDDVGVLSQVSDEITCARFPLSAYSFITSRYGKGKIEVTR